MTVHIQADGTVEKIRGKPFFNPDLDPVFDEWALSRKTQRAFFVSYHGQVYPVDLTGGEPRADEAWSLTSSVERAAGWRPGGTQPVEYYAPTHRLFVLMHRGEEWTQVDPGTEVWVFDATSHRRLSRLHLTPPSIALAVTRNYSPLLFTRDGKSRLSTYRAQGERWQHVGDLNELGLESALLTVLER
jgi:methylamine dehydrogenase heavy chain